ncbi:MAG: response regulator [Eisenbergiella massiliensis]
METVLIADDEVNIREGLKIIIDWNELGFEICGEAANGEEALSAILEKNPSLVLLDIRMPKMYGTDLIRIARERGYKGRFIILSGYSDFTYAQTAIRYGVDFYITKPIDEDELSQAITKIKQGLEKEHAASENIELLKNKAKDVILHEIVTGTYNTAEAALLSPRKMEEMNLYADIYQVVIYEKFSENPEDISYSFADLLKITNKGNHTFEYFEEDGNEVILLKGQFALDKFSGFLERYEKNPPQKEVPWILFFLPMGALSGPLMKSICPMKRPTRCRKGVFSVCRASIRLAMTRFRRYRISPWKSIMTSWRNTAISSQIISLPFSAIRWLRHFSALRNSFIM